MKLMKDMNRDEFIEVIAAMSFRVLAFTYALSAVEGLVMGFLSNCVQRYTMESSHPHYADNYNFVFYTTELLQFFLHFAIAIIFFRLAVPVARLVTRGLSHALELKPLV